MTTDKEELRNVINDSLFGFKDEEYGFTQAETAILIKVEKLLEAKDKEIAELKRHKDQNDRMRIWFEERTGLKEELLSIHMESIDQQITDLKAEIEKIKMNADSVARDAWQHDDLVMLKDLYNACCKYEKERQGLMSWEIPSLHRAKQILSRKYPDMTFDEDGRLIYRP